MKKRINVLNSSNSLCYAELFMKLFQYSGSILSLLGAAIETKNKNTDLKTLSCIGIFTVSMTTLRYTQSKSTNNVQTVDSLLSHFPFFPLQVN